MAWGVRGPSIPESVRDLDREYVVKVFGACNANISDAARKLHVPSADLRRLVIAVPELMAAAFEKEERRLDKAEAILDRELTSDDPRYSAAAAFFVLRNAKRAVARGWRQPDVEVTVENAAPVRTCVFRWEGDEANLGETVMERDGKSFPVPRYDRGDDCLDGEVAEPAVLLEHAAEPEVALIEPELEPSPPLPVWPGPGLPPPLVAHLYAPPPMVSGGQREEPTTPRPAVLRRPRRV
jgi:hypothetical protein